MDTSKLCRSCMKEVAPWETEKFDIRTIEMFCFCTNMKITSDDKLPKQFCYNCLIKIETSFSFITEAQKVDTILKNIISGEHVNLIIKSEKQDNTEIKVELCDSTIENSEEKVRFKDDVKDFMLNVDESKEHGHIIEFEEMKQYKNEQVQKQKVNVSKKQKYVCPQCSKEFRSKLWFSRHMDKEHCVPKFVCEHCKKAFSTKWELTHHITRHSDKLKHFCAECGKGFKWRQQVASHARVHSDVRPFGCDKCGKKFKFKVTLKSHMSIVHDEDKPYLCYVCGSSFALAGNLAVHMRQHTGDKPYSCTECNYRSAAASALKCHQRRHRLARTYVCKECSKGFYDASGLARHVRTHSGELPFQCPSCERAFADSWKRKRHLMCAHRLALSDIPRMTRDGRGLP